MKLTMIQADGMPVPAVLMENGKLLNIARAQSGGLLAEAGPIASLMKIIEIDGPAFSAVRGLADRVQSGDASLTDRLASLGAFVDNQTATYSKLLQPNMIVSCGMGYKDHLREMKVTSLPKEPIAFLKAVGTQNWHGAPIVLPPQEPDMVDFECEFACVIGRSFHNVGPEEVLRHVAGYTMINDVGSRLSAKPFVDGLNGGCGSLAFMEIYVRSVLEKQFPGFCPIGPVIHTADTFGDPNDVQVETRLNGEVMQSAHTSDLTFPIAFSLSYYSRWYRFQPGDVLTTGSPAGVGMGYDPPRYMKAGDVLETSGSRIGRMVNPLVAG